MSLRWDVMWYIFFFSQSDNNNGCCLFIYKLKVITKSAHTNMNNSILSGSFTIQNCRLRVHGAGFFFISLSLVTSQSHQNNKIVICVLLWIHYSVYSFWLCNEHEWWTAIEGVFLSFKEFISKKILDLHMRCFYIIHFNSVYVMLERRALFLFHTLEWWLYVFISMIPCTMTSGTFKWLYLWRWI